MKPDQSMGQIAASVEDITDKLDRLYVARSRKKGFDDPLATLAREARNIIRTLQRERERAYDTAIDAMDHVEKFYDPLRQRP